jgi:hypothetical protein
MVLAICTLHCAIMKVRWMHSDLQDHLDLVISAPSETWRLCGNSSWGGFQGWMVMTENLVRAVRLV